MLTQSLKIILALSLLVVIGLLGVVGIFMFRNFPEPAPVSQVEEQKETVKPNFPELDSSELKSYTNQFYKVKYPSHWKAVETSSVVEEDYAFFVVEFSDPLQNGKVLARFFSGPGTGRDFQCWTRSSQEKTWIAGVEAIKYYYHPLENRVAEDGHTLIPCVIAKNERLMLLEFVKNIPQYTEYSFEFYSYNSRFDSADKLLPTFQFIE